MTTEPPVITRFAEPSGDGIPRPNRPQIVAETIKETIIRDGLQPGDRLPQEPQLMAQSGASKGTIREALKILETQGLIRTRTGPGGGAFITAVEGDRAAALLANHFFFKQVSIADIYALRIRLEPLLVFELAESITGEQVTRLRQAMSAYSSPPKSIEEEREQRQAELDFHHTLAGFSANTILGFYCRFLIRLLRELAVCKRIYDRPNPELWASGLSYQEQLIDALKHRDPEAARTILESHMRAARDLMLAQEGEIERAFLALSPQGRR